MKNRNVQKLEAIIPGTLIVGVDISKETQWARFVDYRGLELRKVLKFKDHKNGFDSILASIKEICKKRRLDNIIIGMEPTGHYWEPLTNYLLIHGVNVVMVNPYHTKRTKELDDNRQTQRAEKDSQDPRLKAIALTWEKKKSYEKEIISEGSYVLRTDCIDLTDSEIWNTYIMLGNI